MADGVYRFDRFSLNPHDRRLLRDGVPVELNARYLDALTLMVREPGKLVPKTRFMDEVWKGVPVTDEALTQCIRTLRRQLGDEAGRPRFIETVPKHGYRFIAPVTQADALARMDATVEVKGVDTRWTSVRRDGLAGLIGGAAAGGVGGLVYGVAGVSDAGAGGGSVSALLVIACLTMIVGALGGAGVGAGIGAAAFAPGKPGPWGVVTAAVGGLMVGGVVKLVGLDAFSLLFGQAPGGITGGLEGALLGAAIGLGTWWTFRSDRPRRRDIAVAGLIAGIAGAVIPLFGGRLMGGSLDLLATQFPQSHLRLDQIGNLFGERGFGLLSQSVTGGFEGLLFGAGVVAALVVARRRQVFR